MNWIVTNVLIIEKVQSCCKVHRTIANKVECINELYGWVKGDLGLHECANCFCNVLQHNICEEEYPNCKVVVGYSDANTFEIPCSCEEKSTTKALVPGMYAWVTLKE